MKKNLILGLSAIALACVILVISLSGFQLAVDTDNFQNSTFVGVYVTTECIYDTVYATHDENAMDYERGAYTFDNQIEGVALYYTVEVIEETNTTAYVPVYSDKLFDSNLSVGGNATLEATLKFVPSDNTTVLYFNKVYQDEDGSVYMVGGDAIACQDGVSFTYDEALNTEIYSESYVDYSCSVKITLEELTEVEKYVVSQVGSYDENTSWMNVSTYTPDDLPDKIVISDENTEYIIFETYTVDGEVERETLEKDDYGIVFAVLEDELFYTSVYRDWEWD